MKYKNINIVLLAICLITIAATFVYAYVSSVPNTDSWPDSFISICKNWDTQHYLKIVSGGYSNAKSDDRYLLIAFFPLFPVLTKAFSFAFRDYQLSGLIVSNMSYIAAVYYLYKLVLIDFDRNNALRSVIYFSIFPTAYLLHAAYTESLFIALTVSRVFTMRETAGGRFQEPWQCFQP